VNGYVRPDPDALAAVAALERSLRVRDYAAAAQLVTRRKVAEGLGILAAMARMSWAEQAYWQSVAEWRADHEATVQRQIERGVGELVALIAEAVEGEPEPLSQDQASRHRSVLEDATKQTRSAA
jgi:N-methylhydantoinase A/oxoprolinase/acetone carboxylase beta subunit